MRECINIIAAFSSLQHISDVVVVITHPLPWDGGMARTTIQVHAVNLIDIRLGER